MIMIKQYYSRKVQKIKVWQCLVTHGTILQHFCSKLKIKREKGILWRHSTDLPASIPPHVFLVGVLNLPAVAVGIFLGGLLMKRYKLSLVSGAQLSFATSFMAYLLLLLQFGTKCDNIPVAGLTVSYNGSVLRLSWSRDLLFRFYFERILPVSCVTLLTVFVCFPACMTVCPALMSATCVLLFHPSLCADLGLVQRSKFCIPRISFHYLVLLTQQSQSG